MEKAAVPAQPGAPEEAPDSGEGVARGEDLERQVALPLVPPRAGNILRDPAPLG